METQGSMMGSKASQLVNALLINHQCSCVGAYRSEQRVSLSFVHSHSIRTPPWPLAQLASRLRKAGYVFIDNSYLKQGLIHAKFSYSCDVWVESSETWDDKATYNNFVFTAEITINDDDEDSEDLTTLQETVALQMKRAIRAFDIASNPLLPYWTLSLREMGH